MAYGDYGGGGWNSWGQWTQDNGKKNRQRRYSVCATEGCKGWAWNRKNMGRCYHCHAEFPRHNPQAEPEESPKQSHDGPTSGKSGDTSASGTQEVAKLAQAWAAETDPGKKQQLLDMLQRASVVTKQLQERNTTPPVTATPPRKGEVWKEIQAQLTCARKCDQAQTDLENTIAQLDESIAKTVQRLAEQREKKATKLSELEDAKTKAADAWQAYSKAVGQQQPAGTPQRSALAEALSTACSQSSSLPPDESADQGPETAIPKKLALAKRILQEAEAENLEISAEQAAHYLAAVVDFEQKFESYRRTQVAQRAQRDNFEAGLRDIEGFLDTARTQVEESAAKRHMSGQARPGASPTPSRPTGPADAGETQLEEHRQRVRALEQQLEAQHGLPPEDADPPDDAAVGAGDDDGMGEPAVATAAESGS